MAMTGPTGTMTGPTGATGTTGAKPFKFDQYYPGGVFKQLLDLITGESPETETATGPTGATGAT